MPRDNEVGDPARTPVPERLSDILPRVVDKIVDRRVATSCQIVGSAHDDARLSQSTDGKQSVCGYVSTSCQLVCFARFR